MSTHDKAIIVEGLQSRLLSIPEIRLFTADARSDERGSVMPSYSRDYFDELGIDFEIVHENHCFSPKRGTIRGFHYQLPPYGQAKLIRVTRGRMLDVNVDVRKGSPTFGQHVKAELSIDSWNQILVPEGFAHCYMTLEDDTEVIFKLGCGFAPTHAVGLAWNDPDLGVDWGIDEKDVTVLERDVNRPSFSELTDFFSYETNN